MGRVGSKPANVEKSSLAGRGTSSAHGPLTVLSPGRLVSPPAKVMAGGAPGVLLLRLLVAGGGAVLAFQLVSKLVASPIVSGYESCPTRRSFSNLFHRSSYLALLAFMMSETARYFCIAISFVADGLIFCSSARSKVRSTMSTLNRPTRSFAFSNLISKEMNLYRVVFGYWYKMQSYFFSVK